MILIVKFRDIDFLKFQKILMDFYRIFGYKVNFFILILFFIFYDYKDFYF